jgi:hypothetical protein
MKTFNFQITHRTRTIVIEGKATVYGDYDGPSKPEAMIRQALKAKDGVLEVTPIEENPIEE